ncbi:MAG: PfkB family carbohydrate kinase [Erysipelotrichaceae bacterium]|nr:PfkB family carbohydrate kinase [Erysipelotrichaceae bacterium]
MKTISLCDYVYDVYENLKISYPGGNAANVAVNASKLGCDSAFLGNLADDVYGKHIVSIFNQYHIELSKCNVIANSSTKKCIQNIVDSERQFIKVDIQDNWANVIQLQEQDIDYLQTFDVIFTSCNAKIADQMYKLNQVNGVVVYDFGEKEKYRTKEYFEQVVPFVDFAQFSMSACSLEQIQSFVQRFEWQIPMLFTRGSMDPILYVDDQFYFGKVNQVKTVDTMGAGDAYITAFIVYLLKQGWKKHDKIKQEWIVEAMEQASQYASEVCLLSGGIGHPLKES